MVKQYHFTVGNEKAFILNTWKKVTGFLPCLDEL